MTLARSSRPSASVEHDVQHWPTSRAQEGFLFFPGLKVRLMDTCPLGSVETASLGHPHTQPWATRETQVPSQTALYPCPVQRRCSGTLPHRRLPIHRVRAMFKNLHRHQHLQSGLLAKFGTPHTEQRTFPNSRKKTGTENQHTQWHARLRISAEAQAFSDVSSPVQSQESPQKASQTPAHPVPGICKAWAHLKALPCAAAQLAGPCTHACGQPWSTCVARDHENIGPLVPAGLENTPHKAPFSTQGYQRGPGTLAHGSTMTTSISGRGGGGAGDPCTQKRIQPPCTGDNWGGDLSTW